MWSDLRKFFENQKNPTEMSCAKTLGNTAKVSSFAQFYKKHMEDLGVLSAGTLLNYVSSHTVNSEQVAAFKDGLAQLPLFLEACYKEVEERKQKEAGESPGGQA